MSFIKHWIIPFISACILVVVFRYFMFDFMIVSDNLMKNSLKKGDLILIQKRARIKRDNIILIDTTQGNYSIPHKLIRCVAISGDTLQIRNSTIFINRKKTNSRTLRKRKILSHYIFHSDSNHIDHILRKKDIYFNSKLANFGIYSFYTDQKKLKKISTQNVWERKQKVVIAKGLHSEKTAPFNKHFYWNNDNFGPLVVPASGMTIRLNRATYELYKHILIEESGKKYFLQKNTVYSDNKKISTYTFKSNYYFVLNDNRQIPDDSRSFGFINENQTFGKVALKLF
ncbi:MAG: signal peptidase I [Bacteroidota bacterium]